MKVELQSPSSDSGDFAPSPHRNAPAFDSRRRLWSTPKPDAQSRPSSRAGAAQRNPSNQSDEDFEFVITRSKTAKKVRRSSFDANDNYRRVDDAARLSRGYNGYFGPNQSQQRREAAGRQSQPRGHPGLERKIDFDPFESTSSESDSSGDVYENDPYPRPRVVHPGHDDEPLAVHADQYPIRPASEYRRRPSILVKIRSFFKTFGLKIRTCFSKSRTYVKRVVANSKNKRKLKKCRDPLLNNPHYLTDVDPVAAPDEEPSVSTYAPSGPVYRKRLDPPFHVQSNSTSSFEAPSSTRSALRQKVFKFRRSKKYANPKKSLQHVKLHSFPDG